MASETMNHLRQFPHAYQNYQEAIQTLIRHVVRAEVQKMLDNDELEEFATNALLRGEAAYTTEHLGETIDLAHGLNLLSLYEVRTALYTIVCYNLANALAMVNKAHLLLPMDLLDCLSKYEGDLGPDARQDITTARAADALEELAPLVLRDWLEIASTVEVDGITVEDVVFIGSDQGITPESDDCNYRAQLWLNAGNVIRLTADQLTSARYDPDHNCITVSGARHRYTMRVYQERQQLPLDAA